MASSLSPTPTTAGRNHFSAVIDRTVYIPRKEYRRPFEGAKKITFRTLKRFAVQHRTFVSNSEINREHLGLFEAFVLAFSFYLRYFA